MQRWAPDQWPVAADWRALVDAFLASQAGQKLGHFLQQRLASGAVIYPLQPFRALALTPLSAVKVVILGQDPYHGPGQAEGLAFSVAPGMKLPPSLRNIFKELTHDPFISKFEAGLRGSLVDWALQGVLLLNTCLSVEEGQPASHAKQGWEVLTDQIVRAVAQRSSPVVFMLWGAHAKAKRALILASLNLTGSAKPAHLLLTANHPSPLSAERAPLPFIGCGHFSQANEFLRLQSIEPIHWTRFCKQSQAGLA